MESATTIQSASQTTALPATVPTCPRWFFGLAAILLLLRPLVDILGFSLAPLPALWEEISLVFLLFGGAILHPTKRLLFIIILWGGAVTYFLHILPIPPVFRWLLLLFFVEAFFPILVPPAWCIFWLLLPPFHALIFGEPLCPAFLSVFLLFCTTMAYRTTLDRWVIPDERHKLSELFTGLALGMVILILPSVPPGTGAVNIPPVVFDESHGSSESALGEELKPNGHQQLAGFLHESSARVSFATDSLESVSTDSLIISILPTRPFKDREVLSLIKHVREGGKLLMIFDHTDMDGAASRFAPIFRALGIQPGFDTISWPGGGFPQIGFSKTLGGTRGFPGTGGSIIHPAFWFPYYFSSQGPHPLVWISGGAFPSGGYPKGGLNDQISTPENFLWTQGPHWVGAWGKLDKGGWAALSDSSWFQNSQMCQNTEFFLKLLAVLSNPLEKREPFEIGCIFLLIFGGFFLNYRRLGKPLMPMGLILGLAFGEAALATIPQPVLSVEEPVAALVLSDNSPSQLTSLQETTFTGNLDVFIDGLFDEGFRIKLFNPEKNLPFPANIWIVPPGDSLIKPLWLKRIEEQVTDGAFLILLGDPRLSASRQLFQRYGLTFETSVPRIYSCENNSNGLPDRAEAGPFPVFPAREVLLGTWSVPLWSDFPNPMYGGQALFKRQDGQVVISSIRHGKGSILAISDPAFFSNGALEIRGKLNDIVKKAFIRHLARNLKRMSKG